MRSATVVLACALAATISTAPLAAGKAPADGTATPLTLSSARVSIEGTSTMHEYTASTTTVRLSTLELGGAPAADLLEQGLQPGGLKAFEVMIPVATLTSPKDGIDKNMHKALKAQEHPEISFRLSALEPAGDSYRAVGWLTIAGVEREVALNLQVQRKGTMLAVTGGTDLLMTDYGVTPPKAMMGLIKTHPKVQIRLELLLGPSLT